MAYSCQNSGGVWLGDNENKGKPYVFGTQEETQMLQDLAKAYSKRDFEALSSFYSDDYFNEQEKENLIAWFEGMESLAMEPYKIIPLHVKGSDFKHIIAWSNEERVYKNGSYESLDLMEHFILNNEGKVRDFKQWKAIDSVNFGMPYGGKLFGTPDNEYTGRPFVFSNRNETQIIEKFVAEYNKMNVAGFQSLFADEFVINDYEGNETTYKNNELSGFFDPYQSVNWSLISIVPVKVYDTEASGVLVYGLESRVFKNGKKWNKNLMEIYHFNLDGKIYRMDQFAKPML